MRVLVIHCHPLADGFGAALRDATVEALTSAGHDVDTRDLYRENFDPVLSPSQRAAYFTEPDNAFGLEDHVAALRWADALVLVYPTWWFGMPAMLKGWVDRVWLPGVAFRLGGAKGLGGLLSNIGRIAVVTTYGSPRWALWWVGWPDRKLVRRGLAVLCAKGCRTEWIGLPGMDAGDAAWRARFLDRVRRHFSRW